MAKSIEVTLELDSGQFNRAITQADKQVNQLGSSSTRVEGLIKKLGGALAAAFSIRELVTYTNTWTDLNSRLTQATGSQQAAAQALSALSDTARRTYSSLEQTADIFLQNNLVLTELGYTTKEQVTLTDALNNALVISGAKGQVAASAIGALNTAFAEGSLRLDQFNTLSRVSPRIIQALMDATGKTLTELRKMASEGLLPASVAMDAMTGSSKKLQDEAGKMSATIGDAFVILRNSLVEYVGSADSAVGASGAVSAAIIGLAKNLNTIVSLVTLAATAFGVWKLALAANTIAVAIARQQLLNATVASYTTLTASAVSAIRLKQAALTGLSTTMGLLGGPGGVILLAATAALYFVDAWNASKINAATDAVTGLQSRLEDLYSSGNRAGLTSELEAARAKIVEIEGQLSQLDQTGPRGWLNRNNIAELNAELNRQQQIVNLARVNLARLNGEYETAADTSARLAREERERAAAQEAAKRASEASAKATADVIQRLQDEITMTKMSAVEQAIFTAQRGLGAEATDLQRAAVESMARVLYIEEEAQQSTADAIDARRRAVENLTDAMANARAEGLTIIQNKAQEIEANRALSESYGVQRDVISAMLDFDQRRASSLNQMRAAAEAAAAAGVEGAWDQVNAATEAWAVQRAEYEETARADAEYRRSFVAGWRQAWADYADSVTDDSAKARDFFDRTANGMTDAIVKFAETGKLSVKDMVADMLKQFTRLQANRAVMAMLGGEDGTGGLTGMLAKSFGGGTNGTSKLNDLLSNAFGGGRMNGGPVATNKSYLVGERGPEMFVPSQAGTIVPNQAPTTNVTYNINAVDAASFKQLVSRDPEFIYRVANAGARRVS